MAPSSPPCLMSGRAASSASSPRAAAFSAFLISAGLLNRRSLEMMPEASAHALAGYVREGGALVAEARLAWTNERGRASERIPGIGLRRLTAEV